ncbi:hypothetical protein Tco_1092648 [Tanacetum coccineum]|uniref:Uncharacterized protein n=1 Tax=Tanacetum coccineum TaxID=301880 RepID=A0ABQ5IAG6_9ASTR
MIISNPEQCNQTIAELPQTLPSVHPTCNSGDENSFTYDPKPNYVDDSPNVFNPPPQPSLNSCEFCGNDARYGHYCTHQVPFIYPEPCYNQDFNFPQDFHDFQQQYLCCENCGGPHATFQCQPMNQDFYNSNPSGFDQFQPSQFPVNYPPQETNKEILQARKDLIETIQAFLKEYDHIPPEEKCMALLLAEERFLKIKQVMEEEQNQPKVMQELLLKLMNDLKILKGIQPKQEEPAVQSFTPYGNFSMIDDVEVLMKDIYTFLRKFSRKPFGVTRKVILIAWERFGEIKHALTDKQYRQEDIQELMNKLLEDYTIIYRKPKAITPDLPIEEPNNSIIRGDEHLNTIPETEKSSVENLVPTPSEFKGISEDICDVPSCDHFDAECGLINSLLSRDILITSPKIDLLPEEFVGELDLINPILPGIDFDEDDCDEVDFDEEEGEIDNDILQIEDEILYGKLLNVNLLVDKIEALKLTPFIPFVLEYPSSSPIPDGDNEFLMEEVDTFLIPEDSLPPGIVSDFNSEEDIWLVRLRSGGFVSMFISDNSNDPILEPPEFESFHFDLYDDPLFPRPPPEPPDVEISLIVETDAPVINNVDELNEDECFDPVRGEINVEVDYSFTFVIRTFLPFLTYPEVSPLLPSTKNEDTIFNPVIST